MLFPFFHLHCMLLLCLKIFYTSRFTSSTVVIAPRSFSQHGLWLNLKDNIFQMEIFLSLIANKFPMWNWCPKFYLKKGETVLAYPKRIDTGMWLYTKRKVSEWEVSFGSSVSKPLFPLEQACSRVGRRKYAFVNCEFYCYFFFLQAPCRESITSKISREIMYEQIVHWDKFE